MNLLDMCEIEIYEQRQQLRIKILILGFNGLTRGIYPGYQRFFLAFDEELRRQQADTSSAEGFSRGLLFKT